MKPDKRLVDALISADKAIRQSEPELSDQQWAERCALRLLESTGFNDFTQRKWQAEELSEALQDLLAIYRHQQPKQHWSHFFALRLLS